MKAFCCSTYLGLLESFQQTVAEGIAIIPPPLRGSFVEFREGMGNFCPVCGLKLTDKELLQAGSQETPSSIRSPQQGKPKDEFAGLHIVTKEEYRGEVPFEKIRPGLAICPVCFGAGKTGESQGIPVACMVCLSQGTLNGRSQIQRAIVAVKGRKMSSADLSDIAGSLREEIKRETSLDKNSE